MKPSRIASWVAVLLLHGLLATYVSLPTTPLLPVAHLPGAERSMLVAVNVGQLRERPQEEAAAVPPAPPPPRAMVKTPTPVRPPNRKPQMRVVAHPSELVAAPLKRPEVAPREIASYRVTDMPQFPVDAFDQPEQGWVVLIVLVREDGTPEGMSIARSVSPAIDAAAVAAVAKWRFEPGLIAGKPVRSWLQVPIGFFKGSLSKGTTYALSH